VYAYLSSRSYEGLNIEIRREQSINWGIYGRIILIRTYDKLGFKIFELN
jgi:hypothetical protein